MGYLGYRIFPVDWQMIHVKESSTVSIEPGGSSLRVFVNLDCREVRASSPLRSLRPWHFLVFGSGNRVLEMEGPGKMIVIDLDTIPGFPEDLGERGDVHPPPAAAVSLAKSLVMDADDVPLPQLVRALTELLSPSLFDGIEGEELAAFRGFVSRHLSEQISTEDIASALGVSPGQLRKLTRDYIGKTPAAYIREQRALLARDLLATTTVSIEVIAERTGYSDRFAFTRAFTAATGVSPHAYRESRFKQHQNN